MYRLATFRILFGVAILNPNAFATTARFENGLTTTYGSSVAVVLAPDNHFSDHALATTLSGLTTGMLHHYRLTATNVYGTVSTSAGTFTTATTPDFTSWLRAHGFSASHRPANRSEPCNIPPLDLLLALHAVHVSTEFRFVEPAEPCDVVGNRLRTVPANQFFLRHWRFLLRLGQHSSCW